MLVGLSFVLLFFTHFCTLYSKRKPRPTWLYCILCILLSSSVKNTVNTFVIFFFFFLQTFVAVFAYSIFIPQIKSLRTNQSTYVLYAWCLIPAVFVPQYWCKMTNGLFMEVLFLTAPSHPFTAAGISTTLICGPVANVSCRGS